MKKFSLLLFHIIILQCVFGQEPDIDFPYVKMIEYDNDNQADYARYGICQFRFSLSDTIDGLKSVKDVDQQKKSILSATQKAVENDIDVLIFPELSVAFDTQSRKEILDSLQRISRVHDMIIFAGSFYNERRENTVPIILPDGIEFSYKIKQSKFEVSPICNEGMRRGDTLVIVSSKYGKIFPIVCVDLISDEIQFLARYFSNKNRINTLINISYNPASHEFMREMSAITKRHELFGIISNVALPSDQLEKSCEENGFGNSSVFATLSIQQDKTTQLISDCFKDCESKGLHPSYSTLISQIDPHIEGMIVLDLNLSTVRPPKRTNAPDQGYPTVRNLQVINLQE